MDRVLGGSYWWNRRNQCLKFHTDTCYRIVTCLLCIQCAIKLIWFELTGKWMLLQVNKIISDFQNVRCHIELQKKRHPLGIDLTEWWIERLSAVLKFLPACTTDRRSKKIVLMFHDPKLFHFRRSWPTRLTKKKAVLQQIHDTTKQRGSTLSLSLNFKFLRTKCCFLKGVSYLVKMRDLSNQEEMMSTTTTH